MRGGELIAVQCAKSRLERDGKAYSPEHLGLLTREDELLAAHRDEWVIPLGRTTDFERGFLTRAKVDASHFYERWRPWPSWRTERRGHPRMDVSLSQPRGLLVAGSTVCIARQSCSALTQCGGYLKRATSRMSTRSRAA